MPNRLASEHSPYLLQHKDNPVDWYPWGDDAFEAARTGSKPIFLSIGYSTCHWCHVMEHESFENAQVAEVLNRHFVSIKVDREERPDVDRVYMAFVQATTGAGGWPMSVWLTPGLKPFYGGTYFPPTSRWGRPGFAEILEEIARAWNEDPAKVLESATMIVERLRSAGSHGGAHEFPGTIVLEHTVGEFASSFDQRRGGFGGAPKFPRPSELLFLLREHARTGNTAARDMVLFTLRAMALGGMRDHLGGGFHRYSVDADWRVPHFEKMLYDQAQLTLAYLEAGQLTGEPFYAEVAADTLEYVRRDLTHPEGGFYSAEDADSIAPEQAGQPGAHKSEGAFYIWRHDEVGPPLGDDADVFRMRYGLMADGNAPFDPQNEFTGKNLLHTARSLSDIATLTGHSADDVLAALARARTTLLRVRASRPRPHLDDKVITAWNGLMIAAFARAGRVLPDGGRYVAGAQRAAAFVRTHLWRHETATLVRRFREGASGVDAYAEDYTYLIFGLLELFQADGDPAWLEWALTLQNTLDDHFWDAEEGGWFSTTGRDPSVLLRLKEDYDGAEPAASSVGVMNLLTLAHLTGSPEMAERVEKVFRMFGPRAAGSGRTVPMLLSALSLHSAGMAQVVVVGDLGAPETNALMEAVRLRYLPNAVVVPVAPAQQHAFALALPWIEELTLRGGRATAYVCQDFTCDVPTTSPAEFAAQLEEL
jgi:uncharacterized protein YyaL (SSP411 family)